jgi:predicted HAD superfamily phosphohydrolase YqeG
LVMLSDASYKSWKEMLRINTFRSVVISNPKDVRVAQW